MMMNKRSRLVCRFKREKEIVEVCTLVQSVVMIPRPYSRLLTKIVNFVGR